MLEMGEEKYIVLSGCVLFFYSTVRDDKRMMQDG